MPLRALCETTAEVVAGLSPLNSIETAARVLGGVHPVTVKRWIRSGRLRGFRLTNSGSSRLYVSKEEIVRFLATAMGE